jgi:prolyl oligopeptidase
MSATPARGGAVEKHDDPYTFLEEVESEESLTFAKAANERCLSALGDPTNGPSYQRILNVLESKDRLAYASAYGYAKDKLDQKLVFNFWKDSDNPKGIWRKTTLEDYKSEEPKWKTVLDVDALAEKDGISWVWKGSNALPRRRDPMSEGGKVVTRSLLSLSRGGSDASFLKEFDMLNEEFVQDDPFELPEAKTRASYKSRDVLLIGSAFADDLEGSLTDSGYPRTVREWERGTPIADAKTVFEGEKTDVAVNVSRCRWTRGVPLACVVHEVICVCSASCSPLTGLYCG